MAKEMLINVSEGEECRIALLENGQLEELYMERTSATSHVGNIYKGKVTNVEASIQAAFIDFGLGRNGFLHVSDLMPTYFGRKGEEIVETVGRKMSRRDRPPIQRCLRRGDEIVVQIIKEGIGTKGPTLSTYLSIPGRIIVMMPGMSKMGVSRKIEDDTERRRLRQILDGLKPPKDVGFIIRTAGIGKTKLEIERDLKYLTRLWESIEKKWTDGPTPAELYTEGDLVTRTVRDVYTTEIGRIIVDSKDVAKRVKEFIKISAPRTKNKVELYDEPIPLFHKYNIERDIELMYSRHVPLPSGGSLVIDSTEAVVAIDVNSGKFRDHSDAETTAFKTDMEAADEIPRQLRLRDLGGVIICDFIDLRYERHRRDLEKRLHDNLRNDRAKTKMLRMSQFGIIEMTRQRMRPSLKRSIYFDCPSCHGAGLVKTPESMSLDVMRRLAIAAHDDRVERIELAVCPDVGMYVLNKKREALAALEAEVRKRIVVRQDSTLALDEMKLELYDLRDGRVYIQELGMEPEEAADSQGRRPDNRGGRRDGRGGRGGRDRNRGRGGERPRRDERRDEEAESISEDRDDFGGEEGESSEPQAESPRRQPRERDDVDEQDAGEDRDARPTGDQDESEAGDGPGESGGSVDEEGGGPKRRRRRRGGRGRNKSGQDGPRDQGGPRDQDGPHDQGGSREQGGPRDQGGKRDQRNQRDSIGAGPGVRADLLENYGDTDVDYEDEPSEGAEAREENTDDGGRDNRGQQGSRDDRPDQGRRDGGAQQGGRDNRNRGGRDRYERSDRGRDEQNRDARNDRPASPTSRPEPAKQERPVGEAQVEGPAVEGEEDVTHEPGDANGNLRGAEANRDEAGEGAEGEGRRRRRRGRRGGRGRNRTRDQQPTDDRADSTGEGTAEESSEEVSGKSSKNSEPAEDADTGDESADQIEKAPKPIAEAPAPRPASTKIELPPVVKTGSTDRHLRDEPVANDPPRRPRSYRDLDAIPDDLD